MKRRNKCVATKRAYATTDECLREMKRTYYKSKVKLRYYECPVCLDFHLTSKGTPQQMYDVQKIWRNEVLKKNIARKYQEFCRLFNKMSREAHREKKHKSILKGILPREERLRILAEMKANQNSYIWGKVKSWFRSAV
jgi:hypothetical protein